ncbi:hypothetical protein [Sporomusa carbonis]|uniref:hypothetical protein n=1 Tax=Sporomusa carbonis TaxID=3076075 RepID=UPI003C7DEDEB
MRTYIDVPGRQRDQIPASTFICSVLAAFGLVVIGLIFNPVWAKPRAFELWPLAVLLISSWASTALGALLWNTSVHHIGASTASLF